MERRIVNVPPARTFSWLGVNGTEIENPGAETKERIEVRAEEERTVLLENETGAHGWEISVGDGATLKLIQIQTSGGQSVNRIQVRTGAGARFEWYRIILGGGPVYDQCTVALEGESGCFSAEIGYRLKGFQTADIDCSGIHFGKKTKSIIHAAGVMRDHAGKILRGTIDFRKGCSGASGSETEDVLLMSKDVRNRSQPVILCAEEHVAGDHGATIGRLDEQTRYYLQSRGISEAQAEKMMTRAKLDTVIRKIPMESIRKKLYEFLEETDG